MYIICTFTESSPLKQTLLTNANAMPEQQVCFDLDFSIFYMFVQVRMPEENHEWRSNLGFDYENSPIFYSLHYVLYGDRYFYFLDGYPFAGVGRIQRLKWIFNFH